MQYGWIIALVVIYVAIIITMVVLIFVTRPKEEVVKKVENFSIKDYQPLLQKNDDEEHFIEPFDYETSYPKVPEDGEDIINEKLT